MQYKERITSYVDYLEDSLNNMLKDIESNRVNPQDMTNTIKNMIRQVEYLSNLVELEQ